MVTVESRFGKSWVYEVDMTDYVDVQAHRGGAGLMPENTIEAMKHCLDMGVNTLEMDFVLSGDGKVVVSHESYFHHRYTTRPDGSLVQKADPKEYLYKMTYDQIAKYDVGVRANDTYPDKACVPAVKPLAEDLITFVENYTKENGLSPVRYNIEIKSSQADGQSINWANYDKLADAIMRLLVKFHLDDRLVVQCFDARTLNYIQPKYPEINFSYLISNKTDLDFDGYMALLKFTPKWLSPHHSLVNEELIAKCREKGMKIVPWTVDKPEDIKRMIDLKVDAIISNYPDRVLMQTRGY
jgi:glycerophosphoryl diester phosphodiesterase